MAGNSDPATGEPVTERTFRITRQVLLVLSLLASLALVVFLETNA
jgi:hypothetical protein